MAEMFQMSTKDFKGLERFFQQSPVLFKKAARSVLNSFAFGTKSEMAIEVGRQLKVRNPSFVRSSIRVNMARGSNIGSMFSEAYTVKRRGFTGWAEQETGQLSSLNRTITKFARGDSWTGRVRSANRLKPSNRFRTPDDWSGRSYEHKISKMLGAMRGGRAMKKQPFIIKRSAKGAYSTMKRGTYNWRKSQVKRTQNFEKKTQPKRIPMMKNARLNYFRKTSIIRVWGKEVDRIMSRYT